MNEPSEAAGSAARKALCLYCRSNSKHYKSCGEELVALGDECVEPVARAIDEAARRERERGRHEERERQAREQHDLGWWISCEDEETGARYWEGQGGPDDFGCRLDDGEALECLPEHFPVGTRIAATGPDDRMEAGDE